MLPTVDAVKSVLKKYKTVCGDEVETAGQLVHDSGISADYKGHVVVLRGDDSVGCDEEVTCKGVQNAIRIIADEIKSQ
jgi:hypothetical protein